MKLTRERVEQMRHLMASAASPYGPCDLNNRDALALCEALLHAMEAHDFEEYCCYEDCPIIHWADLEPTIDGHDPQGAP